MTTRGKYGIVWTWCGCHLRGLPLADVDLNKHIQLFFVRLICAAS
nr:MAG TPA: hypothetical protein [Caudoviricetes sp.]